MVVRPSDDAATETNTSMVRRNPSRRSFLKTSTALVWGFPLSHFLDQRGPGGGPAPLLAYVGTFSSPLRDTLPTQVDLPPGNGRGILLFRIDRTTGMMTAIGEFEMDISPSCLALNGTGTRLYSANETDRVGRDKQGSISAFAVNRVDGKLELLNTVSSGGAGPTYVSVHPDGRYLLVANYHGGSVAVLPILADGRLGDASDVKVAGGTLGSTRATHAPPGSFAISGHDRTHAHMIQADPSRRFVLHADLGLDTDFRLEVRRRRAPGPERSAVGLPATWRWTTAFPLSSQWPLALFNPGGRLHRCAVRLRLRLGVLDDAADNLDVASGFAGTNFCSEILVSADGRLCLCGQPAARQHRDLLCGPAGV